MNALHNLVVPGKVLYLVRSFSLLPFVVIPLTPLAWIVPKANQYVKDHGKTPFSIYQGRWSVLDHSIERDIIPMARAVGLALAPWNVLGAGKREKRAARSTVQTGNAQRRRERCASFSSRSQRRSGQKVLQLVRYIFQTSQGQVLSSRVD